MDVCMWTCEQRTHASIGTSICAYLALPVDLDDRHDKAIISEKGGPEDVLRASRSDCRAVSLVVVKVASTR